MECVICEKDMEGYTNVAEPVKKGECCAWCNLTVVLPARLGQVVQQEGGTNAVSNM